MALTPAQRLRAAADTIERAANAATPGPWEPYPDERGLSDVASRTPERAVTMLNDGTLGAVAQQAYDADAAHIALWDPTTARLIARLLRQLATDAQRNGIEFPAGQALVDYILTGSTP